MKGGGGGKGRGIRERTRDGERNKNSCSIYCYSDLTRVNKGLGIAYLFHTKESVHILSVVINILSNRKAWSISTLHRACTHWVLHRVAACWLLSG